MKPRRTPCAFSNCSLSDLAQVHHRLHVDLVERGQHGGRVLRLHQALGDARAQAGHRSRAARCARRRGSGAVRRRRERRVRGAGRRRAAFDAGLPWSRCHGGRCPRRSRHRSRVPPRRGAPAGDEFDLRRGCGRRGGGRGGGCRGGGRRRGRPRPRRRLRRSRSLPGCSTVSPLSLRMLLSTPSAGAGTSSTTLSVSRSTRFSSRRTPSPGCLCQVAMVPSETDSGRTGTLTLDAHAVSLVVPVGCHSLTVSPVGLASQRLLEQGVSARRRGGAVPRRPARASAAGRRRCRLRLSPMQTRRWCWIWYQAPWFCGSSWHQITSRRRRTAPARRSPPRAGTGRAARCARSPRRTRRASRRASSRS